MSARQRVRRPPREETRRAVLDAAARAFARRGFHGASVEVVAAEAGLSTGAVYSNFKGKEDLFLTLYEERIDARAVQLREIVERAFDAAAGLRSAATDISRTLRRDRDWYLLQLEFTLHAARDARFRRRFVAVRRRALAELTSGLEEALARGGLGENVDSEQLARAIRATMQGMLIEYLLGEGDRDGAAVREALVAVFRGALAAPRR